MILTLEQKYGFCDFFTTDYLSVLYSVKRLKAVLCGKAKGKGRDVGAGSNRGLTTPMHVLTAMDACLPLGLGASLAPGLPLRCPS